jgi:hypothetical protein
LDGSADAEAFAAPRQLSTIIRFVGDRQLPTTATSSFDFPLRDTTTEPTDVMFFVTGSADIGAFGNTLQADLSITTNGHEFDEILFSIGPDVPFESITLNSFVQFHISGLTAAMATAKLSVEADMTEGGAFADVTATQVPEPSSIVLVSSSLIALGAVRKHRLRTP